MLDLLLADVTAGTRAEVCILECPLVLCVLILVYYSSIAMNINNNKLSNFYINSRFFNTHSLIPYKKLKPNFLISFLIIR